MKLERTLKELESAFTDWETLSESKPRLPIPTVDRRQAKETPASEKEFRKKTKKLLNQLRKQLADLGD
jgi:hypothetical protein